MKAAWVYLYLNSTVCLYVGVTADIEGRARDHMRTGGLHAYAADRLVAWWFSVRSDAAFVERHLITASGALWNRQRQLYAPDLERLGRPRHAGEPLTECPCCLRLMSRTDLLRLDAQVDARKIVDFSYALEATERMRAGRTVWTPAERLELVTRSALHHARFARSTEGWVKIA